MDRNEFFTQLLSLLEGDNITSDISYYVDGRAQEADYRNIITQTFERTEPGSPERQAFIDLLDAGGFWAPTDDLSVWLNAEGNDLDLQDLSNAAAERFPALLTPGQIDLTSDGPSEVVSDVGVGGTAPSTVSILTSRDMRWYFDPTTGKWMVSYKLPNSDRHVFFEATGSQLDAIFGEGQRPAGYEEISFNDLAQREGYTFSGDIAEVEGRGTFEGEMNAVIARALDEGRLPSWAQGDPAVMDIIYIAQAEDKSTEWTIEQIAKLDSFKARFPNIDTMTNLGLNIVDAVTGFLEFETGLKQLVLRDGGSPDSVTPDQVGSLLAQGHSLEDAQFVYGVFDSMENNAGALAAFNEVLQARGQQPLDEEGMYEFMAGNAPAEMYDIWEEASLHRAAIDAGLGQLGVSGAVSLARRTEGLTSYEAAYEGLQEAASNLLAFRQELALDQYGLDEQDLIDMSLGLAPSSGRSQAELSRNMQRAFLSAKANRERARVNPFTGFKADGTPQQQSLARTRQETA